MPHQGVLTRIDFSTAPGKNLTANRVKMPISNTCWQSCRDSANIWRETLEAGYRLKISRLQ
ncbi:MAG TPA: hypothetical protein VE176_03185, partial [Candidatus Limnocylindrales bacterium]|nr:hypothetical protein [Candidatus Limnocylindrales bacterium]